MLRLQPVFFLTLIWLSKTNGASETSNITVDITATGPSKPNEGDIVSLTCTVTGPFDNSTDKIVFQKAGKEVITLADDTSGLAEGVPENFQFIQPEKNIIGFFINGLTRMNRGDYICKVLRRKNENTYDTVVEKSYTLNVHYKSNSEPSCYVFPVNTSYRDGNMVTLKCKADVGYPPAPIHWSASIQNEDIHSALQNEKLIDEYDNTTLVLSVQVNPMMNGVIFSCVKQSSDTLNQSCSFGPIEVKNNTADVYYSSPDDSKSESLVNGGIIGGIVGVVVFLIIVLIIVVGLFVRSRSKEPGQRNKSIKTREISGPVANYDKIPTADKADNAEENPPKEIDIESGNKDADAFPLVNQRPASKKYPEPPQYPRPEKNPELRRTNPYANSQIKSKSTDVGSKPEASEPPEYATINPSGETNLPPQRDEDEVYDYPEQVEHV